MSFFDHFSKSTRTKAGSWLVYQVKKREYLAFKPYLHAESTIMEIGPGWGEMQKILYSEGYHNYSAVEPNPTMYDALVANGINVKKYLIPKLYEPDQSYDLIFLADVFEHINGSNETQEFMKEAIRVLRPSGTLCIVSPDYLHWKEDFFISDYTHTNITTKRGILQSFQDVGFEPVYSTYLSGFLTGRMATLMSLLTRLVMIPIPRDRLEYKPYKLFLSFLRRILIIGKKP